MKVMTPEQLSAWLDELAARSTLIAPRDVDGVLLYRPVSGSAEVVLDFIRPAQSVKEAFFPATERLLVVEKTGPHIRLAELLPEGEQIIFGVRPCDARGLGILDALFIDSEPVDPYYARRRANTTLIGLACQELGETCFCTSVGVLPDDPGDVDLMLTKVEDGYAVQAVTDKGRALLADCELADRPGDLPRQVVTAPIPFPEERFWPAQFADDYWAALAERCLSCRLCAYVCPTCRCFDVRDEVLPSDNGQERYERIRGWDSCTGAAYRRIAGGHNPRAAKGDRLRNRFFCKFYYYPQQVGPTACTGCGRCIDVCPVGIDITEVLQHIAEVNR